MLVKLTERIDNKPEPCYIEAGAVVRINGVPDKAIPSAHWAKTQIMHLAANTVQTTLVVESTEEVFRIVNAGQSGARMLPGMGSALLKSSGGMVTGSAEAKPRGM